MRAARGIAWRLLWCALLAVSFDARAQGPSGSPTRVRIQLKWWHQFQFAGYYAALESGGFARAGLDVELVESSSTSPPLPALLSGKVDFAVSDADGLLRRMRGEPLVAVAAIFQHSPYVLLTLQGRGITTPSDLVGRRVSLDDEQGGTQVRAMLVREGIDPSLVTFLPHEWNVDVLTSGRVDAISAYSTVEPFDLAAKGFVPALIDASDYGVDFYGDTLFTTRAFADAHPAVVTALVTALRDGWKAAFEDRERWIEHILTLPGVKARGVTRERLRDEAAAMLPLVLPDVVEVGHMNRGRWQYIADTYVELGLAPAGADWSSFLFEDVPARPVPRWVWGLLAGVGLGALGSVLWTLQLRAALRRKAREGEREAAQRRRMERDLRETEARLHAVLDASRDLHLTLRPDGTIEALNAAVEALLGVTPSWVGRHAGSLFLPEDLPAALDLFARAARGEVVPEVRLRAVDAGGRPVPVDWWVTSRRSPEGEVVALGVVGRDARERERLEARLRQSQRFEAVGRLASGIAHDLNNELTVIGMNAQLLRTSRDPDAKEAADEVESSTARAASMVRQLLAFSRRAPSVEAELELGAFVRELGGMLSGLVGEGVRLQVDASPEPLPVRADATQLEQAVLVLVSNARAVMPQGGRLVLRTRAVQASRPGGVDAPEWFARLDVEDEGPGLEPSVLPLLFDPLSTQPPGTAGLPMVAGLATRHRGWVSVDSAPGRGSTFSVYLPLLRAGQGVTEVASGGPSTGPGSRRALVLQPDATLREGVARALEHDGWAVTAVADAASALAAADTSPFEVVVSDPAPDDKGGDEVAARLHERHPRLPVVVATKVPAARSGSPATVYLPKPYTLEALLGAVRRASTSTT